MTALITLDARNGNRGGKIIFRRFKHFLKTKATETFGYILSEMKISKMVYIFGYNVNKMALARSPM